MIRRNFVEVMNNYIHNFVAEDRQSILRFFFSLLMSHLLHKLKSGLYGDCSIRSTCLRSKNFLVITAVWGRGIVLHLKKHLRTLHLSSATEFFNAGVRYFHKISPDRFAFELTKLQDHCGGYSCIWWLCDKVKCLLLSINSSSTWKNRNKI